jgi:hypothetical protein
LPAGPSLLQRRREVFQKKILRNEIPSPLERVSVRF